MKYTYLTIGEEKIEAGWEDDRVDHRGGKLVVAAKDHQKMYRLLIKNSSVTGFRVLKSTVTFVDFYVSFRDREALAAWLSKWPLMGD